MILDVVKDKSILVVEPDPDSRIKIKAIFDFIEYGSITFTDSIENNTLKEEPYFIVVNKLDDENEMLHQLETIHEKYEKRIPILVCSTTPLSIAIESLITDTLNFPPTFKKLRIALQNIKMFYLERSSGESRSSILFRSLVGVSQAVSNVRQMIEQVADTEANVLILGDSGTGKEVIARNLHNHSDRSDKPFVPVNCGAIPPDLLESELFGHEKGAFTGAISARQGRFELANGGTLFLDEIGDMPLPMQVKLLRVIQERVFERVGSNKSIKADVRIVAATHRNLESEITEGRFREDLFYRLNVFPIEVPSTYYPNGK
jgi:sigma-54 specific flagellar transcriptional regulator A